MVPVFQRTRLLYERALGNAGGPRVSAAAH
jgi:hypothetical protein